MNDHTSAAIVAKIEAIAWHMLADFEHGNTGGALLMVRRSVHNSYEDPLSGALLLGDLRSARRICPRNLGALARMMTVINELHSSLRSDTSLSQRELFYRLANVFRDQRELNLSLLDVCATVGVPRFAFGVEAAARGAVAGCIKLAPATTASVVDCSRVGPTGWPISGNLNFIAGLQLNSDAQFLIVVEKHGIFSRLVEDGVFNTVPCILVCGKGYPSVATRALVSRIADEFPRIEVVGLADFNPDGFALLQVYRRGGILTSQEASGFVCDIKWLGLRASHVQDRAWLGQGEPLSDRDRGLLSRLLRRSSVRERQEYVRELESMADMGKYELQGLYSHRSGVGYLASTFIPTALVRRDYL